MVFKIINVGSIPTFLVTKLICFFVQKFKYFINSISNINVKYKLNKLNYIIINNNIKNIYNTYLLNEFVFWISNKFFNKNLVRLQKINLKLDHNKKEMKLYIKNSIIKSIDLNKLYYQTADKRYNFIDFIENLLNTKIELSMNIKKKYIINTNYKLNNNLYIYYNRRLINYYSKINYKLFIKNINLKFKIKYVYIYSLLENFINFNEKFKLLDYIIIYIIKYIYIYYLNLKIKNKIYYRLDQTFWGFYIKKLSNKNNSKTLFLGLKFLWKMLKVWAIGLILSIFIIYFLCYIKLLPTSKIIFSWLLIVMFIYWFISGFVFFFKKYQYSKFTTVIQRFWKRTYIIFWLIESCIFIVFFYLTLNSSSEPIYMYDQLRVFKSHLFSWRYFFIKVIPVIFIILLGFYLLLNLKWNTNSKHNSIILIITLNLLYILWLEFYQIFHIINFYTNISWIFDIDEYIWNLDISSRRTRLVNNYTAICLFAKFWHLVFIFIFWIFFVLRVNESNRVRYFFLSTNIQNFIILYFMSWLYMYPWLKFVFRKFLDINYFWFFTNNRNIYISIFFNDIKLFYYGLFNLNNYNIFSSKFYISNFFYWIETSNIINYHQNQKLFLRDYIIQIINL